MIVVLKYSFSRTFALNRPLTPPHIARLQAAAGLRNAR